jgi:L-asparagine transporter-like permease
MNPATIFGVIACFSLLLPVLIIIYSNLYKHLSLLSLFIYYLITLLYNLADQGLIPLYSEFRRKLGIVSNYLDVALILIVLLIFCTSVKKRNAIYISLAVFLLFEIFVGIIFKFKRESLTYILYITAI